MYTSGPGEDALGTSRLLNTPILGAAGAGQVISIIRDEKIHTYGNDGVGEGVRVGDMGGSLEGEGGQGLAAGVSHLCQGAAVAVCLLMQLQLHAGALALTFSYFFLSLFPHPLRFLSSLVTHSLVLLLLCVAAPPSPVKAEIREGGSEKASG